MKRCIIASKYDLDEFVVKEEWEGTPRIAIQDMCYEVYDNFKSDIRYGDMELDEAVDEVIWHLEEIYDLQCDKYYSKDDVKDEMSRYFNRF